MDNWDDDQSTPLDDIKRFVELADKPRPWLCCVSSNVPLDYACCVLVCLMNKGVKAPCPVCSKPLEANIALEDGVWLELTCRHCDRVFDVSDLNMILYSDKITIFIKPACNPA